MITETHELICPIIIRKMSCGTPLSASERAHLTACDACSVEIVRHFAAAPLPNSERNHPQDLGDTHSASSDRQSAIAALEHGRKVFERDLGIVLPEKK